MTHLAHRTDAEAFLASEFQRIISAESVTKRTAARLSIMAAITNGLLPKGGLVPTEQRLTKVLGISLGTVQAALQQLQQYGVIVRRRGDGTRVAATEAFGKDIWHFRILDKQTNAPMRTTRIEVEIGSAPANGPWSSLFPGTTAFTRIRRRLLMSEKVKVGAEMILPDDLAPGLAETPPAELKMLNIRPYLAERHGLMITRAEHLVSTTTVNDLDAVKLDLPRSLEAFEVIAHAFQNETTPGYWQRILLPCADCRIML